MSDQGLMTRKSVDDIKRTSEADSHKLSKTLGPFSIMAMGIGAIIGAGIFVLTGTAAAQYAGPSIMLSFVLGGVACAFVGLCYAELAAMLPVSGSCYTYTYATLGEVFAWMIGWDLVLEYAMGAATVAVGWSGYVVSILRNIGIVVPPQFAAAPGHDGDAGRRQHGHRHHKPAGAADHRRADGDAGIRDQGVGPAEQHHGRNQAGRRRRLHRRRRVLCELGELAPVHPGQHRRVRPLRL